MPIKRTVPVRVPIDIAADLNKALDDRLRNRLISRKDAKLPEGFRLLKRMPEWNLALDKLRKLPKKEDLK